MSRFRGHDEGKEQIVKDFEATKTRSNAPDIKKRSRVTIMASIRAPSTLRSKSQSFERVEGAKDMVEKS